MGKNNKHQTIVDSLEARLKGSNIKYDLIKKNTIYGSLCRDYGEIDLYALNAVGLVKAYMIFFEVKSSYTEKNYRKAIEQLTRIKDKFTSEETRNWFFYVYGTRTGYTIQKLKL